MGFDPNLGRLISNFKTLSYEIQNVKNWGLVHSRGRQTLVTFTMSLTAYEIFAVGIYYFDKAVVLERREDEAEGRVGVGSSCE